MKEQLEKIKSEALAKIDASDALEKLNEIRVAYLGKKGELTTVLKSMKDVAPEDRPKVGQLVNEARAVIEGRLEEAKAALAPQFHFPAHSTRRFLLQSYKTASQYPTWYPHFSQYKL